MLERTESQIMEKWEVKNTDNPLVSISCMTYNHEKYIAKAIESFLQQETKFPFEIIIHDDASTDSTAEIVQKFVNEFPNIIKPIFETENQYSKRDGSLGRIMREKRRGKYFALCEGDDYWCSPIKLQAQVDFMEAHPECSLCSHNTLFHYIDGSKQDHNFNGWTTIHKMAPEEIFFGWNVHTSSYLLKRDLEYKPEFARLFWFGAYVYLTMASYYGDIYVLPDVMSVYNANITEGVTVQNEKNGSEFRLNRIKERVQYLKQYDEYTNHIYEEIVQARISEIIFMTSDKYLELIEAAKKISKNRYYTVVFQSGGFKNKLKIWWKYKGYIFGYLWYFTILFHRAHLKKSMN